MALNPFHTHVYNETLHIITVKLLLVGHLIWCFSWVGQSTN